MPATAPPPTCRPSRRRFASLLALALLGRAGSAPAAPATTVFSCRDDDGQLITSDRPIDDCADRPMAVHGADGRVRREIEAPPTEEELQQQAEEAAWRRANRRELEARSQRDRVLVEQYRSMAALERARARELGLIEQRASLIRARIRVAEDHLRENARSTRSGASEMKTRQAAVIRGELADDRAALAALDQEAAELKRRYDADAQRLRALRAER